MFYLLELIRIKLMFLLQTLLCINMGTYKLKLKLIKDGIKTEQCEICKLIEWNGQKIPLELHHIDGNGKNNNIDNLQIICPNCSGAIKKHIKRYGYNIKDVSPFAKRHDPFQ